jgi:uncharacterized membrane protein
MARIDAPAAVSAARLPWIDALRGAAILAMIVYHFSWDLRLFGFIEADVTGDPGWRMFARSIAGTFLALVGVSLVLATRHRLDWSRYLRRLGIVAAAAVAVTVATRLAMPDSYVFFGILHAIAVSSVLGLLFVQAPIPVVFAACAFCFIAPALLSGPAFDAPPLLWLGLATYIPRSNDYVPVFPWFAVVLAGIGLGRLMPLVRPGWLQLLARAAPRQLVWAGRHSLAIYLLHQPILIGLVYLAAQISPPDLLDLQASFLESCSMACVESDQELPLCRRTCGCLATRTQAEGLWDGLMRETLSERELDRYWAIASECRQAAEGS